MQCNVPLGGISASYILEVEVPVVCRKRIVAKEDQISVQERSAIYVECSKEVHEDSPRNFSIKTVSSMVRSSNQHRVWPRTRRQAVGGTGRNRSGGGLKNTASAAAANRYVCRYVC